MSSWNMPPGVSTNDIPGNRPEDIEEENFWEALAEKFAKKHPTLWPQIDSLFNTALDGTIAKYVAMARDMGYERGYNAGQNDAEMAMSIFEMDVDEELRNWLENNPDASAKQYLAQQSKIVSEMKRRMNDA